MTDFVSRFRAHPRADRTVTYLADGRPAAELTHLELDRRARAVASWLTGSGMAGRPVLLLYPAGLDFLVAFLGCLYARAVAVPAPLPLSGSSRVDRVDRLVEDSGARLVLTDEAHVAVLGGLSARAFDETDDPDSWEPPEVGADTVAYLQYTSGSTSRPRGVEVTHGGLTHNLELFGKISGDVPVRRIGGWLPHHHDMGLVGLQLQALHAEADLVLLSPEAVVARPIRWLRAISDHRVDWTVAPDFGYAWATRRIGDEALDGLDLSCLTMAVSGAEPIRIATLDAFADRFASVGFRRTALNPGYGLAESTLVVTCTSRGRGPTVRSFTPASLAAGEVVLTSDDGGVPLVGCGEPGGMEVRIVDAAGVEVGDGTTGEIRVAGPSLAAGYHGDPAATSATFVTGLDGRWLRTGDLGFLLDGQLYVTGRLKELIIVRGRNLYPHDIEHAAREAHPDAGRGAAFGVRDADSVEHVVLVQEMRRASRGDPGRFADAVLDAVTKQFGVFVSVVVVRSNSIRHTTSGKVRRGHMRELFLDGGLSALHSALSPAVATVVAPSEENHV
ncbi:fatty acyl-AMP ligase [Saccharothrix stipae]